MDNPAQLIRENYVSGGKAVLLASVAFGALHLSAQENLTSEEVFELEAFTVVGLQRETERTLATNVFDISSIYGESQSMLETPRAVSLLTTEAFVQYGIEDFNDAQVGVAGFVQTNNFGLPGTPSIRGDRAGVFFHGMERPFIGNKFPTSFGSFESMEVIKGVAPAHFGATAPGGIVNLIPKSPFFDERAGFMRATIGTYDKFRLQGDIGGPVEIGERRAAFRVSLTGESSGSYYDNIEKDAVSLYGSLAIEMKPQVHLLLAAEYYRFGTNENPGWNRVTQDLIDHGTYILGETVNLVDDVNFYGTAARYGFRGREVPPTSNPNGTVPNLFYAGNPLQPGNQPQIGEDPLHTASIVVPGDLFTSLTADERLRLHNINGEFVYTADYLNGPDGIPFTADDGRVATTTLEGSNVLADPNDYADSEGFFLYGELSNRSNSDMILKHQFFLESFDAEKLSSYNYANETEQMVAEYKLTIEQNTGLFSGMRLLYGGSIRYNYGSRVADASPEPFSRRDLSNPVITGNSVLLSGPQRARGGPVWYQGGDKTDLYQAGIFGVADIAFSERFSTIVSGRFEAASFKTTRPNLPYMRDPGSTLADGQKNYWNLSISPVFRVSESVSLYGTAHQGASILYGNSGTILGESNFADSELIEGGLKWNAVESGWSGSLSVYHYDREDYDDQFGTLTPLRGKGIELESVFALGDFSLIGNITWQRQNQRSEDPGFRFFDTGNGWLLPLVAGAGYYQVGAGDLVTSNNPDMLTPGTPEWMGTLNLLYEMDNGFGFLVGPTYRESFWLNWEHTLKIPAAWVWNANVFYRAETWEIMARFTNVFEEDYFFGGGGFSANALVTKMPGLEAELVVTFRF